MNIYFGTKKLGVADTSQSNIKYPDQAVLTVEAEKDAGRSRRITFNAKAGEALGLEGGFTQNIVFGHAVDANGENIVLIANASLIPDQDGMTTYRTSKNKVTFEDSKERGKAISSSTISNQISDFLSLDNTVANEFVLESLDNDGFDSFVLKPIESGGTVFFEAGEEDLVAPVDTIEETVESNHSEDDGLARRTIVDERVLVENN